MNDNVILDPDTGFYIYQCPHCSDYIETERKQLNCKIFRHGVYKANGIQVPPHSKKPLCDRIFHQGQIYGCGKPYQIYKDDKNWRVRKCDYI